MAPHRRTSRLARLFCFVPGVSEEPRASKRARSAKAAAAATAPPHPPPSPSAEALVAYLGRSTTGAPPPCDLSAEDSIPQTSTYCSSGDGSGSLGSGGHDAGYDADSDCPPSECSPGADSRRCFRPAQRHHREQAGEQGGSVNEIVRRFERLSMSSSSRDGSGSSSGRRHGLTARTLPTDSPCPASTVWGTTCTAELALPLAGDTHPHDAANAGSQPPSRSSSMSGALSLAASGSVSLAHFLVGSGSGGSSRHGSKVRRVGSTQLVVEEPAGSPGGAAAGPAVQQRLSEIQGGHFISLEKLRSQCGDLKGPPGDLLSLMARRVFASRSSFLAQRLRCEGELPDLQAAETLARTPAAQTVAAQMPPAPPTPSPAPEPPQPQPQPQPQPAQPQPTCVAPPRNSAEPEAELALPQLRRIRTRVGQLLPDSSENVSGSGGAASMSGGGSGSGSSGRGRLL